MKIVTKLMVNTKYTHDPQTDDSENAVKLMYSSVFLAVKLKECKK